MALHPFKWESDELKMHVLSEFPGSAEGSAIMVGSRMKSDTPLRKRGVPCCRSDARLNPGVCGKLFSGEGMNHPGIAGRGLYLNFPIQTTLPSIKQNILSY